MIEAMLSPYDKVYLCGLTIGSEQAWMARLGIHVATPWCDELPRCSYRPDRPVTTGSGVIAGFVNYGYLFMHLTYYWSDHIYGILIIGARKMVTEQRIIRSNGDAKIKQPPLKLWDNSR